MPRLPPKRIVCFAGVQSLGRSPGRAILTLSGMDYKKAHLWAVIVLHLAQPTVSRGNSSGQQPLPALVAGDRTP